MARALDDYIVPIWLCSQNGLHAKLLSRAMMCKASSYRLMSKPIMLSDRLGFLFNHSFKMYCCGWAKGCLAIICNVWVFLTSVVTRKNHPFSCIYKLGLVVLYSRDISCVLSIHVLHGQIDGLVLEAHVLHLVDVVCWALLNVLM